MTTGFGASLYLLLNPIICSRRAAMPPHLPDETIDLLLLSPGELDPEVRRQAMRHMAACRQCRAVADELAAFYGELHHDTDVPADAVEKRFAEHFA